MGTNYYEDEDEVTKIGFLYKYFNICHPPSYERTLDLVVVYNWIIDLEIDCYACQYRDKQRVKKFMSNFNKQNLKWWLELKTITNT